MSHFLSTFYKTKTAWGLVRIPSCEHFFISWCRQSGLHWGKTAYRGQWILRCRFESNFWEILLQQDTCTVQLLLCDFLETSKEVSKFGTCCFNKVQLLMRRLLPIRSVLSIIIKSVCITELYVSRLWQICTALWQQQGGINIVEEFWLQCHVNCFIYNRINKIYLPTTVIKFSVNINAPSYICHSIFHFNKWKLFPAFCITLYWVGKNVQCYTLHSMHSAISILTTQFTLRFRLFFFFQNCILTTQFTLRFRLFFSFQNCISFSIQVYNKQCICSVCTVILHSK